MEKSTVWFDLETTGTDIVNDRIIEACFIKINPDGTKEVLNHLINPGDRESSPGAIEKHKITAEMLHDKPTFSEVAQEIYDFIGDSHLGGYNIIRFDVPFLSEEFYRAGIPFNWRRRRIIDPYVIYAKYEPKTLEGAYKRYTGNELKGAHRAEADIEATIEVFMKQQEMHPLDGTDHTQVAEGSLDLEGKFIKDDEGVKVNFGKYKDRFFKDILQLDPGYFDWMIKKADFSRDTKIVCSKLIKYFENAMANKN